LAENQPGLTPSFKSKSVEAVSSMDFARLWYRMRLEKQKFYQQLNNQNSGISPHHCVDDCYNHVSLMSVYQDFNLIFTAK